MCGRVTDSITRHDFQLLFGVKKPDIEDRANIPPRAPLVILRERDGQREALLASWGFQPRMLRDEASLRRLSTFNARSERVEESPVFRHAFQRTRALIPVSGWLEWRDRQPYLIRRQDHKPIVLAGLYEERDTPGGLVTTCTVLTTAARGIARDLHERQPHALLMRDWAAWLNPTTPRQDRLRLLNTPYPVEVLEAFPVSNRIGSTRNQDAELLQRAS